MHARAFSGNEASYGRGSEEVNRLGDLETSVLYCDDNLERLSRFPDGCIDLIYLDPPFVWRRTTPKGLMSRRLARNHDVLLSYQMSNDAV